MMQTEEIFELDTFMLEMNGKEVELAITDEFVFEGNSYILCAEVDGDMVKEDEGVYLFRAVSEGNDISVETIESEKEYYRIAEAYYDMCEHEEA